MKDRGSYCSPAVCQALNGALGCKDECDVLSRSPNSNEEADNNHTVIRANMKHMVRGSCPAWGIREVRESCPRGAGHVISKILRGGFDKWDKPPYSL